MVLGFSRTRLSPIAIDFGAERLKLLQLAPAPGSTASGAPGEAPELVAAAQAVLPPEARHDPQLRREALIEALSKLLKSQPFKGRRAICSLPAFQTLSQNIEVTPSEGEALDMQVALHLRQRLNVQPERMIIRPFPVGMFARQGGNVQEVLCLAAPRDVVMGYIEIARQCKLDIVGMHSEAVAVLRAFDHLQQEPNERAHCFIDIGAGTTKAMIAHGTRLVFAKTIQSGGHQAATSAAPTNGHAVAEPTVSQRGALDRPLSREASPEQSKSANAEANADDAPRAGATGLAALDAQMGNDDSGIAAWSAPPEENGSGRLVEHEAATTTAPAAKSAALGEDALECIADELKLCLRHHQNMFPDAPVEKLIFLGGGAKNVENCQGIARRLRVAAQVGDPLARLARGKAAQSTGVNLDEPQPGWAVPFGLCLSEANL